MIIKIYGKDCEPGFRKTGKQAPPTPFGRNFCWTKSGKSIQLVMFGAVRAKSPFMLNLPFRLPSNDLVEKE